MKKEKQNYEAPEMMVYKMALRSSALLSASEIGNTTDLPGLSDGDDLN